VGWIVSRIEPGASSADVAKAIDATFDVQDTQTLSQDEGSFQHSFMGGMSAVLSTMDVISIVILVIMVLILANTVAMGARERTSEYGVLRAIGFLPGDIAWLVIGEATVLGIAGGIAGLGISVLFVNGMMGRWIEENVSFFPYFRVVLPTALLSLALAVVLGLLSGIFPAWQSSKLKVVDALRRVA
jgi:putative ABC transport system permease protein